MPPSSAPGSIVTDNKWLLALTTVTIASATTVNGTEIDTFGYSYLTYVCAVGTIGDASCTLALAAQDSATSGSGHANITGAAVAAAITGTNGEKVHIIRLNLKNSSRNRYHRINATTASGASQSAPIGVVAILSNSPVVSIPITQAASINVVAEV